MNTPREAILDYLSRRAADLASVRFTKERCGSGWCAYALEFVDADGYLQNMFCQVAQHPDGEWRFVAGTWGQYTPLDEQPLDFHFDVGGWPTHFTGGGRIIGRTKGLVERVRFSLPKGLTLEDRVEDSWVLAISEDPPAAWPVLAELVAKDGAVLWSRSISPARSGRTRGTQPRTP